MINLFEACLDELKAGGDIEKAKVYAMLCMAQALTDISVIADVLEDRTLNVTVNKA